MEPAPPPITIVDPHAPPSYATELLEAGDDREPFAWTPRRRYVALTAVTVATLVAGVASAVDMVREGHRLDRASVKAVQLYADAALPGIEPAAEVQLSLRNDGPTAVSLLSARLMAPGYGEQPLSGVVGVGESVVLHLPDEVPCGPSLLKTPVEELRLRVRTDRAQVVTRELTLGPSAYIAVNHPARERCGYLPPDEAFTFGVQWLQRQGHEVVVKALLHDESVLPLTLVRVAAVPGLEVVVSPRLPLPLPPQSGAQRRSHFVSVELRIRVSNCSAFFSAPGLTFLADRGLVRGWVAHDASIWEVPIDMSEPEVGFSPVPDVFFELLQDGCPQLG